VNDAAREEEMEEEGGGMVVGEGAREFLRRLYWRKRCYIVYVPLKATSVPWRERNRFRRRITHFGFIRCFIAWCCA